MQDTTRMLRDALDRVAPVGRHAIVIGEALRNGGLLDVPSERGEFRAFVNGPLLHAARSLLGKDAAKQLLAVLLEQLLSVGNATLTDTLPLHAGPPRSNGSAPAMSPSRSGSTLAYVEKKPKIDAESTLPYAGDEPRGVLDVALLETDAEVAAALTEVLEQRDYRVLCPTLETLASLCHELPIRLVFAGTEHARVLAAVRALGDEAPGVVFLSDSIVDRPSGVVAILPKSPEPDLVEALDAAVRYGGSG